MLRSRSFVALLVLAGLGVPALAQDTVEIKWKLKPGETFYQEMTTKTEQKLTIQGMNTGQNQEQTFYFSWLVKAQDDKTKNWTIVQKIEGVKMKIEIGGQPINYDSTQPANANNPLADFFKAIVGAEFTLSVSPDFKVLEVQGKDKFIQDLTKANPTMEPLLKQVLSEDAIKQMADPSFAAAPNKAVKKGESWDRPPTKLDMGPIGSYETTYKYTFDGLDDKDKNLARIKVDTTLKYVPPMENAAGGSLPFRIKSAALNSSNAGGEILFDVNKGRPASSKLNLKLEGKLTIEVSGMATEVDLTQTQETTTKTTDENPIKSAAPAPAPKPPEKPGS